MRVGSLFSGIGGFDLGFEQAGMEVAWQCEIDKHARAVLAKHWPGVPCYDDVRAIGADADVPRVDLICGGFPCQDVSVAGRRAGLAGERSGLWFEFHRVLAELRPNWVVIENVPGLRSSNAGADLWVILRGLAELGYMGAFWSPDAQWFGVAQRRERVFIVGYLGDGRAVEVLPIPEGMCGNPPARATAGEDVAGTLGGSSQGGGFRTTDLDNNGAFVISRRGRGDGTADEIEQSGVAPALRTYGGGSSIPAVAGPITATYAKTADNIQDTRAMEKAQNGIGVNKSGVGYTLDGTGAQGVYVPDVAYAITAREAKGVSLKESQTNYVTAAARPRRLTPTECERLQGFPDGWTSGQADSHRYKQLGNAVAVPVVEWIGRRIVAASATDV